MKLATLMMSTTLFLLLAPIEADAHCDTEDGPVATAGHKALETGQIGLALAWVQPSGEAELRRAFEETMEVRKLGGRARTLADRYFLETLVRIHRQGEGEPYTGLKPAGTDVGPAIRAADRAAASGSPKELEKILTVAVRHGLRERVARVKAGRGWAPTDVAAGRAYVAAYVDMLHFAEGIYNAAHGEHGAAGDKSEARVGHAH